MMEQVRWSDIDLDFIEGVKNALRRKMNGVGYEEKFQASDFLVRFKEEPLYIYHFDEVYWAEYIFKGDVE